MRKAYSARGCPLRVRVPNTHTGSAVAEVVETLADDAL